MSLYALVILLFAALIHAGWNVMVKLSQQKHLFLACAMIVGDLCFLPFFVTHLLFPLQVWPFVVVSALLEGAYFFLLAWAYDLDDFSLLYPLVRGIAPLLLLCWSFLFLHERPDWSGICGIFCLVVGLMMISGGISAFWSRHKRVLLRRKSIVLACITALCVSWYTVVDGAAVHLVASAPYTVAVFGLTGLLVLPFLWIRYGPRMLIREVRVNWWRIFLTGIALMGAYMLVLFTYTIAPVNYAGAVREVSVVFAAFFGWRFLGERFGMMRLSGAACIFIGILLISLAG